MTGAEPILALLLKLAVLLLPVLLDRLNERKTNGAAHAYKTDTADFGRAIADRDVDFINVAFRRMRVPAAPGSGSGSGRPGNPAAG